MIDVGQDVLGRGWRTDDDPQTSQEQGEVTGKCLEDNRQDDVSTKAFSEYCQAEAYAPSFDPRD